MTEIKRIVIAESRLILRKSLSEPLSRHPSFEVVGEAVDRLETARFVESIKPDVVLTDLSLAAFDWVGSVTGNKKDKPFDKDSCDYRSWSQREYSERP